MGKRKQDCPRKVAGETGKNATPPPEVSRLEGVVKKLKTVAGTTVFPANLGQGKQQTKPAAHPQSRPLQQLGPLDLRLPKFLDDNKCSTVFRDRRRSELSPIISATADSALDLSKSTTNLNQRQTISSSTPTAATTPATSTFQQLSARLEEYFSTGIVASKFPRKMVRGQDVWMQDIEQKRAILKCLKCGVSYNTLAELSKHIRKTGHHEDVMNSDAPHKSTTATYSQATPVQRRSPPVVLWDSREDKLRPTRVMSATPVIKEFLPRPSAFKPLRPESRTEVFQPRTVPVMLGYVRPETALHARLSSIDAARNNAPSPRMRLEIPEKNVTRSPRLRDRLSDALTGTEVKKEVVSDVSSINPQEMPGAIVSNVSPLSALKKFLDFGFPRLKPTGIDGGRI